MRESNLYTTIFIEMEKKSILKFALQTKESQFNINLNLIQKI